MVEDKYYIVLREGLTMNHTFYSAEVLLAAAKAGGYNASISGEEVTRLN